MSGVIQPPDGGSAPLLTPAHAQVLLDQVIYEQVLDCVDVDALVALERSLTMMLEELDGVAYERARMVAKSMLDRAVLRLPDDIRHYLRAAAMLSADCDLCEAEAREARGGGSGSRRPSRFKS
jgi:hypothetical protein